jgi:SHS2 domain-containing protein
MKKYEFLEHPADIKIRAFGKDLPEVFINAALGMMSFLYAKQKNQEILSKQKIIITAENLESLLVNWLSELLWLSDTKHVVISDYRIKNLSPNKISASVSLIKAKAKEDIKAVTYNDLLITKKKNFWVAEIVFDI